MRWAQSYKWTLLSELNKPEVLVDLTGRNMTNRSRLVNIASCYRTKPVLESSTSLILQSSEALIKDEICNLHIFIECKTLFY